MKNFARIDPAKDAERGATFHVTYEGELLYFDEENEQPITIDFVGPESRTGKEAAARMVMAMDKLSSGRNPKKTAKDMSEKQILQLARKNEKIRAKYYAELSTGWENVTYIENEKLSDPEAEPELLEWSQANAFKLFSTRTWIMEGIDDFLSSRANFSSAEEDA